MIVPPLVYRCLCCRFAGLRVWQARVWLWFGVSLLAACGGGGGGANSGQAPDPVVIDTPLAYVQRPVPLDGKGELVLPDMFDPAGVVPGAELYVKDRPTVQAAVSNISRAAVCPSAAACHPDFTPDAPNYDVKDIALSGDGRYIAFALRLPDANPNDEHSPSWNIWEYDRSSGQVRRVINDDFEAEKGNDVSPRYLPNGRILFSSDRQSRSREILLNEGRPPFANTNEFDRNITSFQLHSMRTDGSDIQQLSFNQSHSIAPSLLADGRVLFLRWDGPSRSLSFYTMNPDGTQVARYFGYDTLNEQNSELRDTARLFQPQPLPDGRIAAIYMYNQTQLGGDIVALTPSQAEGELVSLAGQAIDITPGNLSVHGRFASLAPLGDGTQRLLVSWSQCRLFDEAQERLRPCVNEYLRDGQPLPGYREAQPLYGIWIYNLASQTQLPVVLAEEGRVFTEAIALSQPLLQPAYIASELDAQLAAQGLGALHIRSLYDRDGRFDAMASGAASLAQLAARPAAQRPARFVRFIKAVSVPDNDSLNQQPDTVYGRVFGRPSLVEILGYAPVEADGSVFARLPADVAFSLQIVDSEGRRIGADTQWISLRPGQIQHSHGLVTYGREDLAAAALNTGAAGGASFAGTQRYDDSGAAAFPDTGETMAQFAARLQGISPINIDINFSDAWHTPASDAAIALNYNQLPGDALSDALLAPAPESCREPSSWTANCRIVINYEYHIQPLWERERESMTLAGESATRCTGCHSNTDAGENIRVPLGQLLLSRTPRAAANIPMASYRQLLLGGARPVQYLYEGALVSMVPACEFSDDYDFIPPCEITRDEYGVPNCPNLADCAFEIANATTGALVLDATGNPIPVMRDVEFLLPPMSAGGAHGSGRFFNTFNSGGSHAGFLNASELKLLYEWLDTGGQYYTNLFDRVMFE